MFVFLNLESVRLSAGTCTSSGSTTTCCSSAPQAHRHSGSSRHCCRPTRTPAASHGSTRSTRASTRTSTHSPPCINVFYFLFCNRFFDPMIPQCLCPYAAGAGTGHAGQPQPAQPLLVPGAAERRGRHRHPAQRRADAHAAGHGRLRGRQERHLRGRGADILGSSMYATFDGQLFNYISPA